MMSQIALGVAHISGVNGARPGETGAGPHFASVFSELAPPPPAPVAARKTAARKTALMPSNDPCARTAPGQNLQPKGQSQQGPKQMPKVNSTPDADRTHTDDRDRQRENTQNPASDTPGPSTSCMPMAAPQPDREPTDDPRAGAQTEQTADPSIPDAGACGSSSAVDQAHSNAIAADSIAEQPQVVE